MIHFTGEKEPHLSVGYISPVSVMWVVVEISCPVSPDSVPDTVWSSSSPHKQRETPLARSPLIVWCLVTILSRGITMKESGTAATATIKLRVKCYVEEPISQISNYTKVKLPWKLTRKSQGIENKWFKTLKNIYCWTRGKCEGTVSILADEIALLCADLPLSTVQCSALQYSTVQYSKLHCFVRCRRATYCKIFTPSEICDKQTLHYITIGKRLQSQGVTDLTDLYWIDSKFYWLSQATRTTYCILPLPYPP